MELENKKIISNDRNSQEDLIIENKNLKLQILSLEKELENKYTNSNHNSSNYNQHSNKHSLKNEFRFFSYAYLSNIINNVFKKNHKQNQIILIKKSNLFNEPWYLSEYPDIVIEGIDPVEHWVIHGYKEGRNPSPDFNTVKYMNSFPDIDFDTVNPLVHYIENRQ